MLKITSVQFKRLLPFIIIVIGIVVFILLKATQPTVITTVAQERSWRVHTFIAHLQRLSPSLTLYGQIEAPLRVNATTPKNSRVSAVYVLEGEAIHKGQLLLTLDARDFKPLLQQAKARIAELKALIQSEQIRHTADKNADNYEQSLLALKQAAVVRANMLKNKKLGSTATLELAQETFNQQQLAATNRQLALDNHASRLQQLQARLAYAQADFTLARLDLERSQIIAPFDGFVEKSPISTGEYVKENQILLTFYAAEPLEVRTKIPVLFQDEIQQSIINKQPLNATANYADTTIQLTLSRLSGVADARGVDALFTITLGNNQLRPGDFMRVLLQRPAQNKVLKVPYTAVYDNQRIYRINNNRLQGIAVKIVGSYVENQREKLLVFSPQIQAGDRILGTYLPHAIEGLKVDFSVQNNTLNVD